MTATITSPPTPPPPTTHHPPPTLKRGGGNHPIFGIYVGGLALNQDYKLTSAQSYSSTSQFRTENSLNMDETSLHSQRGNSTSLKFNGELNFAEGNTDSLTELNLEGFLRAVGVIVKRFGIETFCYRPDSTGSMKYLPEGPRMFNFASVQAEHESRIILLSAVLDRLGNETPESIAARFKCYDAYEIYDWYLSRLAIEALVHLDLREEMVVLFNHTVSFKKPPGSVSHDGD